MSNIINAIRLDFRIVKSVYKTAALIFFIAIFVGITAQPAIPIFIIMVFSVFFSGVVFSISEKNHLNKLYGILPLGKSEIVIGRYLYALIFGVVNAIIASIIAYLIAALTHSGLDYFTYASTLALGFLYFCFAISVSFPIYFKIGFSKAYIFTMLPMYLILISGIFISKKTNVLDNFKQMIQYFMTHQNLILPAGVILGLILLLISCLISNVFYKNADL